MFVWTKAVYIRYAAAKWAILQHYALPFTIFVTFRITALACSNVSLLKGFFTHLPESEW